MDLKGNLIAVREDVRLLDATVRDGGLCNNSRFSDEFVRALYLANAASGVDYMEFGYKCSRKLFDTEKFGKWKFCADDDIRAIIGDAANGPKVSVMADVGRCDYKEDILPKSESPIDLVRVAAYVHNMPEALAIIEDAAKKGYETSCNIMAISNAQERDLRLALEMLIDSPVEIVYIVDSFGSLYPEEIRRIYDFYYNILGPAGKKLGIHAHNNQQCAFANTIESLSVGVSYLDGTVYGMGRGAGNASLEGLLGFLRNPKYRLDPMLKFIESYMLPLKASGVKWGYDIPYLLTGLTDQHPRSAIAAVAEGKTNYSEFYQMLLD